VVWTLSGVEGVPAGHIVHFILNAVEQLPITDFRGNDRGSGSEQYNFTDPESGIVVCVSYNFKRLFALKNLATEA
jgi:hypothetical protein